MPHCTKCGAVVAESAAFCAACGAPQSASSGPAASPNGAATHTQMAENVAGLLCYVLGFVTGLIFYFLDKRPSVRFHAMQSIAVFGAVTILFWILGMFFGIGFFMGGWGAFSFAYALHSLLSLAAVVLWILLMVKAYQGERFRVPIAADLAEKIFGKS